MQNSQTILIVEDDPFIGAEIEMILIDSGFAVLGPCPSKGDAFDLLEEHDPDFALLDVEIQDGRSFPVARALAERSIPFAFVTGRPEYVEEAGFDKAPVLAKPFTPANILAVVKP